MKIGIVLHSYTGNTKLIAEKISKRLQLDGHTVEIKKLELPENWEPGPGKIIIDTIPELESYDAIVFGSPVEAFSLSPTMKAYFSKVDSLKDRKVLLFVTHQFPFAFMGGNRAIRQMRSSCEEKGADIISTYVIDWSNSKRENQIENCIEQFSKVLR